MVLLQNITTRNQNMRYCSENILKSQTELLHIIDSLSVLYLDYDTSTFYCRYDILIIKIELCRI